MDIVVLIKDSEDPRNIGSAARAMKTMGHSDMRLINCCDHLCGAARALAHGSNDILETAKCYEHLETASEDIDLLVATTIRHRRNKMIYTSSRDLPSAIANKGSFVKKVGILFGGEKSGLKNEDLDMSDIVSTIPTANPYPALNLSQAVMVYSYALSDKTQLVTTDWRPNHHEVGEAEYVSLKKSMIELLRKLGLPDGSPIYRQMLQGLSRLNADDLYLVHAIRKKVMDHLNR